MVKNHIRKSSNKANTSPSYINQQLFLETEKEVFHFGYSKGGRQVQKPDELMNPGKEFWTCFHKSQTDILLSSVLTYIILNYCF